MAYTRRAGLREAPPRRGYGRGRRRRTSRATPPATRAPVDATPATVRMASPTESPPPEPARFGGADAPVAPLGAPVARFRPPVAACRAPAARFGARPVAAFGAALAVFLARGAGPVCAPLRSVRAAAFAAVLSVRFSLRCPGRERGRFPSTPPSSVIAGGSLFLRVLGKSARLTRLSPGVVQNAG
jgi:hypothetical protein